MNLDDLDIQISEELEEEILYSAIEENIDKEDSNKSKKKSSSKSKDKKRSKKSNRRSNSSLITRIKTNINIRTVLILLLTLIVNTYAWFVYVSSVSAKIQMHVKSWNFELYDGSTQQFDFIVNELYPGMETVSQEIDAVNRGETEAELSCEIASLEIFGETFVIDQEYTAEDGTIKQYTADDLFNKLSEYPFKINIYINGTLYDGKTIAMGKDDEATIKFEVVWDYESGDDELDTEYGLKSYEYMNDPANDVDRYMIKIISNIKAVEKQPETTTDTDTDSST